MFLVYLFHDVAKVHTFRILEQLLLSFSLFRKQQLRSSVRGERLLNLVSDYSHETARNENIDRNEINVNHVFGYRGVTCLHLQNQRAEQSQLE